MADYIITRTFSDELKHFGIKGQKWGVRRYQNDDGTLTPAGRERYGLSGGLQGNDKLAKKYSRDIKKLKRAYENADLAKQIKDYSKYEKNARTAKRIGNAALGIALPSAGIFALTTPKMFDAARSLLVEENSFAVDNQIGLMSSNKKGYNELQSFYRSDDKGMEFDNLKTANRLRARDTQDAVSALDENKSTINKANNISMVIANVAAAASAVSYGVAAYNKVRSTIAKSRISEKGHEKAMAKARALTEKMSKTFENTPYKVMLDTQVKAYKEEHPNTQMSDRDILRALMPLT